MSFQERLIVTIVTNLFLFSGLAVLTGKWTMRVWFASVLIGLAVRLAVTAR